MGRFSAQEKAAMERAAKEYAAGCDLPTDDLSWLVGVRKGMDPPLAFEVLMA